jgi:hypothetical protein
MRIETTTNLQAFTIYEAPALDPILVVLQDFGGGVGRLLVECYGDTWSTYWGAMGDRTLEKFIIGCSTAYIVNRMFGQHHKRNKGAESYLTRIVTAVQAALVERSQAGKTGDQ